MISLVGRIWIPIVMALVATVGTVTVLRLHAVFGSHQYVPDASNAEAIIGFNSKHVRYEIFGSTGAFATINYLDADAQPHEVVHTRLPWSFTIVTTLTAVVAHVVAQGNSDTLGCRIIVNGLLRAERVVVTRHAQSSCLVKSA